MNGKNCVEAFLNYILCFHLDFHFRCIQPSSVFLHIIHAFHIVLHFHIRRYSVHMSATVPVAILDGVLFIACDAIESCLIPFWSFCFFLYFLVVRISMVYGILWNGKSKPKSSSFSFSNGLMLSVFILFRIVLNRQSMTFSHLYQKQRKTNTHTHTLTGPAIRYWSRKNERIHAGIFFQHINALNRLQKYANRFFSFFFPFTFFLLLSIYSMFVDSFFFSCFFLLYFGSA